MTISDSIRDELAAAVRDVPDFPKPGILFKDITPLLADGALFAKCVDCLTQNYQPGEVDAVVGIDARGFIFGAPSALKWGCGFIPIRKTGKLPSQTVELAYDLEYGSNKIAVHADALKPGSRVVLIDDLLATGGTAAAALGLLNKLGARILEVNFVIELSFLHGRQKLKGAPVRSLVVY
jgi:adenine phosphoribosyltransferase